MCSNYPIFGPVAQLGERLHGMQEVASSILVGSKFKPRESGVFYWNRHNRQVRCRAAATPCAAAETACATWGAV